MLDGTLLVEEVLLSEGRGETGESVYQYVVGHAVAVFK